MTIGSDQLSLFLNQFHNRTFESVLELAGEAGLRRIGLPYGVWPPLEPEEIARRLEGAGIDCRVVNLPARIGRLGERDDVVSQLTGAIEMAAGVGAGDVQFHFKVDPSPETGTVISEAAARIRPMMDLAASHDVGLLLENNFDSRNEDPQGVNPARSAEGLIALWEEVGSDSLGFCYDPSNFVLTGREPFPDQFGIMSPHIRDIHIKDCTPLDTATIGAEAETTATDSVCGKFQWTRLGEGRLPWPKIMTTLVESCYQHALTLEPVRSPGLSFEEWAVDAAVTARRWIQSANAQGKR